MAFIGLSEAKENRGGDTNTVIRIAKRERNKTPILESPAIQGITTNLLEILQRSDRKEVKRRKNRRYRQKDGYSKSSGIKSRQYWYIAKWSAQKWMTIGFFEGRVGSLERLGKIALGSTGESVTSL